MPTPDVHPFRASSGGYWIDTVSRLDRVREMGAERLKRVLALPDGDLQKTVRRTATTRLRRVEQFDALITGLEAMLLTSFLKVGATTGRDNRIRVVYRDSELRLNKVLTFASGRDEVPDETTYWADNCDTRFVFRIGDSATAQRAVIGALLGELEKDPKRVRIVEERRLARQETEATNGAR